MNIGVANYEADDVIGTLAKIYSKDNEVHIVTGDRDILQCINEQVEVWLIRKGFNIYHHYTLIVLMKSMHYIHFNLLILKHLWEIQQMGILLKVLETAIKLIQSYGSVETLDHIESLTPGQQKKLQLIKKNLILSKQLAEIYTDVPIDTTVLYKEMEYTHSLNHILFNL